MITIIYFRKKKLIYEDLQKTLEKWFENIFKIFVDDYKKIFYIFIF